MAHLGQFSAVERSGSSEVSISYARSTYFRIAGVLKVNGVAAARRIVVLDRKTLEYVRSCTSKPDGTFEFKNLPAQDFHDYYVVIAFDDTKAYNAEVIDFVKQVEVTGG